MLLLILHMILALMLCIVKQRLHLSLCGVFSIYMWVVLQTLQPDPSKKAAYDDAFDRHQRLSNALFEKRP